MAAPNNINLFPEGCAIAALAIFEFTAQRANNAESKNNEAPAAAEKKSAPTAESEETTKSTPAYQSLKYLMSLADLEKHATQLLGTMDNGSYDDFVAKMHIAAKQANLVSYKLGIGSKFKPGANPSLTDLVYPITKDEWEVFKSDARTMCEYMPKVFLIDSSKYVLPI